MLLDKNTQIRYINNGKQYVYKILFCKYFENKIPVYYSSDVDSIKVLQMHDKSLIVLCSEKFMKNINNINTNIIIWRHILKVLLNISDRLTDTYCIKWFGYKSIIDNINNDDTIPDDTKDFRIKTIETLIEKNIVINTPSKEEILADIN
ncbi:MAG: hypothetical protein J6A59_01225 [Lachnospiraceae bacterium]|nr:hypothetical protein [Lachnospiraceae bacterium]